ncbi:hypothetical protein D3C72_2044860 [compost metagenome]
MSFSLLALTIALSKDNEISRTANTVQMKKTVAMPPSVPVDCQPSQAPSTRPTTVTMKAHLK